MNTIKAIQTRYKGYHFRSRLEARWGVFFDALGYDWEYESQGFDLGEGVYYLPDFTLNLKNGIRLFVEVKPSNVAIDKKYEVFRNKIANVESLTSVLVSGDPRFFFYENLLEDKYECGGFLCHGCGNILKNKDWDVNNGFSMSWYCFICDCDKPNQSIFTKRVNIRNHKGTNVIECDSERVIKGIVESNAYDKARSARFEFGETPL